MQTAFRLAFLVTGMWSMYDFGSKDHGSVEKGLVLRCQSRELSSLTPAISISVRRDSCALICSCKSVIRRFLAAAVVELSSLAPAISISCMAVIRSSIIWPRTLDSCQQTTGFEPPNDRAAGVSRRQLYIYIYLQGPLSHVTLKLCGTGGAFKFV